MALSLFSAAPELVLSIDGAALRKHPQVVKLREELDRKAVESGGKTLADSLAAAKLSEEVLDCRFSLYADTADSAGVLVIDTPEGKAPELFRLLCSSANFADGGTKTEIAGCSALAGTGKDGEKLVFLLRSPAQIQVQVREAVPVPLDFSAVSKSLVLAAKSGRLANLALIPTPAMRAALAASMPSIQALRLLTLGIDNKVPEAELVLEGTFSDADSAQAARMLVDMMFLVAQQNPLLDPRLFQNISGDVAGGRVVYRRTIDAGFIDGLLATLGRFGVTLPGAAAPAAALPEKPAAEPAAE